MKLVPINHKFKRTKQDENFIEYDDGNFIVHDFKKYENSYFSSYGLKEIIECSGISFISYKTDKKYFNIGIKFIYEENHQNFFNHTDLSIGTIELNSYITMEINCSKNLFQKISMKVGNDDSVFCSSFLFNLNENSKNNMKNKTHNIHNVKRFNGNLIHLTEIIDEQSDLNWFYNSLYNLEQIKTSITNEYFFKEHESIFSKI